MEEFGIVLAKTTQAKRVSLVIWLFFCGIILVKSCGVKGARNPPFVIYAGYINK
jgi:hypothetical protein